MEDRQAELIEELSGVTSPRRKWWVVKFEDGYYGEHVEDGFDFKLCSKKEDAERLAQAFLDGIDYPYEIVEICIQDVRHG